MRKIILVLFLLAMLGPVLAQTYSVYLHEIRIDVAEEGGADVVEKFFIYFPDEENRNEFRQLSTELGSNIEDWAEFNPLFKPNIGRDNLLNKKISYNESDATYLELSYTLGEPIMARGKQKTNNTEYILKATHLKDFFETNVWVIPENTIIYFVLPSRAEIVESIEPQGDVLVEGSRQIVKWEGYKSANQLNLKYLLWSPPTIEITGIIDLFFYTFEGQIFIIIMAIILLILLLERKKLSSKIEDFVSENSKIEEV